MASSRSVAAEIFPNDEALRTLLEVYLALAELQSGNIPIHSAVEEAGRILRKNGVSFEADEGGTLVGRMVERKD